MIRFINIEGENVGATWDGQPPYIHWFGGQQSTDLIYVHKIAFASDKKSVRVHMESNVFHFLALDTYDKKILQRAGNEIINNFEYVDIKQLYDNTRIVRGWEWNGIYLYVLYIAASSKAVGEVRETFYIDDEPFTVGADFYGENEPLYVNLSNNELNIPVAIQRAIYSSDIHEEKVDHILLNRKWKELLSNYWDVVANKGNYKSLLNSLKWFEWGNFVKLREIWAAQDFGRTVYTDAELRSILTEQYQTTLQGYRKTTFLALDMARQELGVGLDSEKNPELEFISSIWSWEELSLKLCLLGSFYETYFMPIHLDLIRSTIEDVVYTNTIKVPVGSSFAREDFFTSIGTFRCSVKDGDSFVMNNVQCQVGDRTIFGQKTSSNNFRIVGVEKYVDSADDQKSFWSQHYGGIGAIVHFDVDINLNEGDFIKHQILTNKYGVFESHILLSERFGFDLLFTEEGEQDMVIQFNSAQGHSYSKRLKINIVDVRGCDLKVYRLIKNDTCEWDWNEENNKISANDYIFRRQPESPYPFVQYIPSSSSSMVGLNRVLILTGDWRKSTYLQANYYIYIKTATIDPLSGNILDNPITYTCCISKNFWQKDLSFKSDGKCNEVYVMQGFMQNHLKKYQVYRSDFGYFGEFHHLEELGDQRTLDAYTVTDKDALVVVPEFKWGAKISNPEWIFKNATIDKIIKLPSVNQPFIADTEECTLEPGYYDITFNFVMGGEEHSIHIDSSFIKK